MKRLILIITIFLQVNILTAQDRTYSNSKENISFTYANHFKEVRVQSAKHMLLKLESGASTIALSKWNYGIDDSYTIWSEEIVQLTRENLKNSGTSIISFDKRYVNTKSGKKKTLLAITYSPSQNMHILTYQFIHKGNLIQVLISNRGKYDKGMLTTYDQYIYGLQMK